MEKQVSGSGGQGQDGDYRVMAVLAFVYKFAYRV